MAQLVAKRYSNALFSIAVEERQLDEFEKSAEMFLQILDTESELKKVLEHPHISDDEKNAFLKKIFRNQLPVDFLGLVSLLCKKGRESELEMILILFLELVKEHKNIIHAEVTSAIELSEKQILELTNILSAKLNKCVVIKCILDPSIIAGLKVKVAGMLFDGTVEKQILDMKKSLLRTQLDPA